MRFDNKLAVIGKLMRALFSGAPKESSIFLSILIFGGMNTLAAVANAKDAPNRINPYYCMKQKVQACNNTDDLVQIITTLTQYDADYVTKLVGMEINGGRTPTKPGFDCHVNLSFVAKSLLFGFENIEQDFTAARNISEYLLDYSWEKETPNWDILKFGSTTGDALLVLDYLYVGDWAALRASDGSKTAQCFHAVTLLKDEIQAFARFGNIPIEPFNPFRNRFDDLNIIRGSYLVYIAYTLLNESAKGADGNSYSALIAKKLKPLGAENDDPDIYERYRFPLKFAD